MSDQIELEAPPEPHEFKWGDIVTVTLENGRVSKGDVRSTLGDVVEVYVWELWRSTFKGDEKKTEEEWAKEHNWEWMGGTKLFYSKDLGYLRKGIEDGFGGVW